MLAEVMMNLQELPSKKVKDLRGLKFGHNCIVKAFMGLNKHGVAKWLCLCNCGREFVVRKDRITRGLAQNCPRCSFDKKNVKKLIDILGIKFGENCEIIKYLGRKGKATQWQGYCKDCNNYFVVTNNPKTCGCPKSCPKCSRIELTGQIFGNGCIIIKEAESKNKKRRWLAQCKCGLQYIVEQSHVLHSNIQECLECGHKTAGEKQRGDKHWNYNFDLTDDERNDKRSSFTLELRMAIYRRDNFICQLSGKKRDLVIHHLDGWNKFPDKRFDIDNCITLTEVVHEEFHNQYGRGNNTKEQFEKFKRIYNR